MDAEYMNEYDEWEPCLLIACGISGRHATHFLIELNGELGWCSAHLVDCPDGS